MRDTFSVMGSAGAVAPSFCCAFLLVALIQVCAIFILIRLLTPHEKYKTWDYGCARNTHLAELCIV
jgi:hypothetical protein